MSGDEKHEQKNLGLLLRRLKHLMDFEGLGHSTGRYPGNIPEVGRSLTGRHFRALGPDSVGYLEESWPAIRTFQIWPDFRQWIMAGIEPMELLPPVATVFDEPVLGKEGDESPEFVAQLVRRLVYVHEEEFPDSPMGLVTAARAWCALRSAGDVRAQLCEMYLDATRPAVRRFIRFFFRDLVGDWEHVEDADLFRAIAANFDRYDLIMNGGTPERLARLERAGMLSPGFKPYPLTQRPPTE